MGGFGFVGGWVGGGGMGFSCVWVVAKGVRLEGLKGVREGV